MSAFQEKPGSQRRLSGLVSSAVAVLALLAAGRPAEAAVVTRMIDTTLSAENIETLDLDLDQNGTPDFTFTAAYAFDPNFTVGFDTIDFPFASTNAVVVDSRASDGFPTASRLRAGDTVSGASLFSFPGDQGNLFFSTPFDPASGNFNGQSGFLGLRFEGTGGTLYGFAQISVNAFSAAPDPLDLTIGTVGYETAVGQAIRIPGAFSSVPEPGGLALLGAGGLGFLAARRRRRMPTPTSRPRSDSV